MRHVRRFRLMLVVVAAAAASACLQVSTLVRVKPDGSGTIEQTLLFNPGNVERAFAEMGLKSSGSAGSAGSTDENPVSESDVRKLAPAFGSGVSLVSMMPVKLDDGYQGVRATFAFTDVTKLRGDELLVPGPTRASMTGVPNDGMSFAFERTPRGTSMLVATFNENAGKAARTSSASPVTPSGLDDESGRQMARILFDGFRVGMDLEVDGAIVNANADHVGGNRVTLFEIDLDALIADWQAFETIDKVFSGGSPSLSRIRSQIAGVSGLKINRPVVKIEFK